MTAAPLLVRLAVGEALGLPLNGRKPLPHPVEDYPETPEDHRNDPVRFSRRATYGWPTQLALATADASLRPGPPARNLADLLAQALSEGPPELLGVFRNVPLHLRKLLERPARGLPAEPVPTGHLAALAPVCFLRHQDSPDRAAENLIEVCLLLSSHLLAATAALAALAVLAEQRAAPPETPRPGILAAASRRLAVWETALQDRFSARVALASLPHLHAASDLLSSLADCPDEQAEDNLVAKTATELSGHPVPRPSHPWPLAAAVFGLLEGLRRPFPASCLHAVSCGGEAALTGLLAAAVARPDPDNPDSERLMTALANRRQIALRQESLEAGRPLPGLKPFVEMERDLSEATVLELRRHIRRNPPRSQAKPETPTVLPPDLPDRRNKRLWREYLRQKSKEKKRRRG